MALVHSHDLPIGSPMPAFELADPYGKICRDGDVLGPKGLLVAFTCNHCPYAIAVWPRLVALAKEIKSWGVGAVAINPNIHPDYPEDAPERMKDKIAEWGIDFPYLVDKTQNVAREFDAQCTPDLYLYDAKKRLFYHGRLDDNWKDPTRVSRQELRDAALALVEGKPAPQDQYSSMGCSIKWRV